MCRPATKTGFRRRGTVALEFLLILPIVMLLTAGFIQFAMMLTADSRLLLAAYNGATAARHGGSETDIRQAVDKALLNNTYKTNRTIRIYRVDPPTLPFTIPEDVLIATIDPANVLTLANPPVNTQSQPTLSAIKVVVEVRADKVAANLLKYVKYDLANYTLNGSAVLPKE
jgi:Flp pilus assembly protein TadG